MSAERPYDVWQHLAQMDARARQMRAEGKPVQEVVTWRNEKYRLIATGALSGNPFEESFVSAPSPKDPSPMHPREKIAA